MITFSDPSSKYFGVYHDLRCEEFANIDFALKAGVFAVIEQIERTRINGTFKNTWCDYKVFDEKGNNCSSIKYLKWGLEITSEFHPNYQFDKTEIRPTFTDPCGKKTSHGQTGSEIVGIKSALRKLAQMSVYESYQNFTLSQRIIQLEAEISELKNKSSS